MKTLIGFVGNRGAGKDTAAGMLAETLKAKHKVVYTAEKFAGALKSICWSVYQSSHGVPARAFEEDKDLPLTEYGLTGTGRDVLKTVGDALRQGSPDVFVRLLKHTLTDGVDGHMLTDVRFLNEAAWVRQNGGLLVRLTRNSDSPDDHPTETELARIRCDYIIDNRDMDLDQFRERVEDLAYVIRS